ncbi:DUF916 and DUF3324 domain-containing protein [Macrococcus bovicus]|uniref:DUF916 and DUF3324 domain-containing protein n=1 Tax=Macrococcus bovicus TaxID=69968 RepID=A0A4R6C1Q7_9STAP|nr:DUF916 and DUF3324 domain-containing protein [Macrococcus bovicus]TDM14936.1 DUF916 and DUF3324 domain-containing protein [Macrococcus bovicus]
MKKMIFVLITLLLVPSAAYADTGDVPFSVAPVFPDNQSEEITDYFDLEMKPGDEQQLKVKLFNTTAKMKEITISANSAVTNGNGLIVYDGSLKSEQQQPFSELAEVKEKTVKLAPGETRTTSIKVKAPDKDFDGELLGGLHFLQKADTDETGSVQIKNNYAYVIAVRLHEQGNDTAVEPKLSLKKVKPALAGYRTAVKATFVNEEPVRMSKLKFDAQVFRKGSDKPLYVQSIDSFAIAPDGTFEVPMLLNNQPLEAGDYIYKATFKDGSQTYPLQKEFTINREQAEKVNSQAIELDKQTNWWLYIAAALLAIIGLLIYLVVRLSRKVKG